MVSALVVLLLVELQSLLFFSEVVVVVVSLPGEVVVMREESGRLCWVVRIVTGPWGWHHTASAISAFIRKG